MDHQFYEAMFSNQDEPAKILGDMNGKARAANICNIFQKLGILRVQSVVDIGSGTGSVLANLMHAGFGTRFAAVDISHAALEMIDQRTDLKRKVDLQVFDGVHLPFADQSFDVAVLSHVIEHLQEPKTLLREASRVARFIVVEVPLEDNLYTRFLVETLHKDYRKAFGHIQWFNYCGFRKILQNDTDLSVLDVQVVPLPSQIVYYKKSQKSRLVGRAWVAAQGFLRWMLGSQYRRFFTDHCIAVCQKEPALLDHPAG